jgi:hypothetical protein
VQRAQRRIGADLHDGLGQELTGISLILRHDGPALRGSGVTLICRVPVHSRRLVGTPVV